MSLTSRHFSILIGLSDRLATTSPVLVNEEPTLTNEGWDHLTQIYTVTRATLSPETLAGLFPVGARLGSRNWWITGSRAQERAAGFWIVALDYSGWAQTKPSVIRVGASAASQTAENVIADGTLRPKVETHQNTPTITVSYLVANVATAPKTGLVGTEVSPPVSISVPSSVWATLNPYLYHFPNGWVLMESAEDRLPGATAALVTDTYQYFQIATPG
jgi:hypothetical protein